MWIREGAKSLGLLALVVAVALWVSNRANERRHDAPALRPGEWQESDDATRVAMESVVNAQLEALRERRFLAAYSFAASDIQKQISSEGFERMIWSAYPELTLGGLRELGEAVDNGKEGSMELRVASTFGPRAWFAYFLVREADQWRVVGVARQAGPRGRGRWGR